MHSPTRMRVSNEAPALAILVLAHISAVRGRVNARQREQHIGDKQKGHGGAERQAKLRTKAVPLCRQTVGIALRVGVLICRFRCLDRRSVAPFRLLHPSGCVSVWWPITIAPCYPAPFLAATPAPEPGTTVIDCSKDAYQYMGLLPD